MAVDIVINLVTWHLANEMSSDQLAVPRHLLMEAAEEIQSLRSILIDAGLCHLFPAGESESQAFPDTQGNG